MSLLTPNTDFYTSFYDKAKYIMAWRLSSAISMVFLILTSVASYTQDNRLAIIILISVFILSISCFIYLNITKKFIPIFYAYIIIGTALVHLALNQIVEIVHYGEFLWITVIILLAFVGLGKRVGVVFIVIHAIGIGYFYIFSLNHHIEFAIERTPPELINDIIDSLFSLFVLGYLLQQYIAFNTYSEKELKKANVLLSKKNEENVTLVKEVHHRVKNNLQIIISLLRLQKAELKSTEAKKHFSEAINRIMVMSLIHKKLYQEKELAHIDIQSYLTDLSEDIQSISDLGFPVDINIKSDIKNIGLKTIVPLGLLINELLTNSIKHAFFKRDNGTISITILNDAENKYILTFSDNGKWKEPHDQNPSFGIELIGILTSQLEGDHKRTSNEKGTIYTFNIKNIDIEK